MKRLFKNKIFLTVFGIMAVLFVIGANTETKKDSPTKPITNTVVESNKVKEGSVPVSPVATNPITIPMVNGNVKVHYIDVGQADSILIQSPNGKSMLIDAGNNPDGNSVVSYIKSLGINKLDVVVGTHPHEDHIGGMDIVINNLAIGDIYMSKAKTTTKTFEDVLLSIKNKGAKITSAVGGMNINFDKSIKTEILAPNGSSYDDLNNYSVVIKMTYGNKSFLFEGDAENLSENEMLSKGYDLKADVLKIGHHGSKSSTSANFLKAVNPKQAVISVGKGNSYGHPAQDTVNRLLTSNVEIFRTDTMGTIVATCDKDKITFDKKSSPVKENAPPNTQQSISNSIVAPVISSGDYVPEVTIKPTEQTEKANPTVYTTNTGKKYHKDGCISLNRSKIPISLEDALNRGLEPCKVCGG